MAITKYREVSAEREAQKVRECDRVNRAEMLLSIAANKLSELDRSVLANYANELCKTIGEDLGLLARSMSDAKFYELEAYFVRLWMNEERDRG